MTYSSDAFIAIDSMLDKFGLRDVLLTKEVIDYRMRLLTEEYQEVIGSHTIEDAEGIVDGHVDLIVIAMGNLAIFGVDSRQAFDRVMEANMAKELSKRRPTDPEGSSIAKPDGWVPPDHSNNHGGLDEVFSS